MMTSEINKNFSCDIETKQCAPSIDQGIEELDLAENKKLQLIYYTDPICSACWAIEPQLRRFKLEYGVYFDIEYKMGGLLPGWEGFADRANGISKPTDVAHHWDEVGQYSGMSIDGDIWLEDPLASSFPASIAFKAAQKQGKALSLRFLRKIREMLFLEKKNITKEHFLLKALEEVGGDTVQFLVDYHDPKTEQAFLDEMQQRSSYGVRGFPTFIFINPEGKGYKISGMSSYEKYVEALEKSIGHVVSPRPVHYTILELLQEYPFLTTKEIVVALSKPEEAIQQELKGLLDEEKVYRTTYKYGAFWGPLGINTAHKTKG